MTRQQPPVAPSEPKPRPSERVLRNRRRLAAIGLGALILTPLVAPTIVNAVSDANYEEELKAENQDRVDFNILLDEAATKMADPSDIIEGSTITNPGNHLYDEAKAFADEQGLDYNSDGVDTILQTAIAISKANLIQPNSEFVITQVNVDEKGPLETIVQLAPVELPTLNE